MKGKGLHHKQRIAHALRFGGFALIAASLAGASLRSNVAAALAAPLASVGNLVAAMDALPVAGSPAPSPSPSPASAQALAAAPPSGGTVMRGGPLTFGVSGNLSVGERVAQSAFGAGAASGQSQANSNAGLLLELQRRTGTTMTAVNLPLGVTSVGPSRFGMIQATYATPRLGLTYQAQPLGLLGQVPLGSTLLGYGLILPIKSGDVTAFQGPIAIENGLTAHLMGVRARRTAGSTIYEAGYMQARSESTAERANLALFGFSHASGPVDETLEAAIERRIDAPAGDPASASAYQFRTDFGSQQTYGTLTLRRQSSGFLALGNGDVSSDSLSDLSLRKSAGVTSLTFDGAFERAGDGSSQILSRRDSLTVTTQMRGASYGLALQEQRQLEAGTPPQWTGSIGAQIQAQIFGFTTLFQGQAQRLTGTAPGSNSQYGLTLQKQLGRFALLYSGQVFNSTAQGSNSLILTNAMSGTAQIGQRNSVSFGTTFTHTRTPGSDALAISPIVTLNRVLSPALTMGLNFGEQFTHDPLNPASDGHSRIFNIQLNAPFSFGSAAVSGRPNPHLPATITGSVIDVVGATNFVGTAASSNGLSNVEVVLDDTQVQRTDLLGHFQFNFVTPGRHDVRVETASLPRGVTADQPYAVVDVLGGQSAQVLFQIGNFGGIEGHVFGRSPSGDLYPISGVQVQLDQIASATTSNTGAFGFGRLSSGNHTIALVPTSLPADAAFAQGESSRQVVVQNGSYTNADFTASPLGSIAGRLMYDSLLGAGYANQGVNNAYVVAEPGEHAAITNDDGTFLLDNLPAGQYTVNVDPETLPDGMGNSSPQVDVMLAPGEHRDGLSFTIGKEQKKIVFSFRATEDASTAMLDLSHDHLPPGGQTLVSVTADEHATSVAALAFGETYPLQYSRASSRWEGTVSVPGTTKAGVYTVSAVVHGKRAITASSKLTVDPGIPAAFFQLTPSHPLKNQYTVLRARFLVAAEQGDRIIWQDGQISVLPKPNAPHMFVFTVKISEQPFHGLLLTRLAKVPITVR